MRLHGLRPPRLREDLEQLVVGQEEEPWEGDALRLEVVLELLLDALERVVELLEEREPARLRSRLRNRSLKKNILCTDDISYTNI